MIPVTCSLVIGWTRHCIWVLLAAGSLPSVEPSRKWDTSHLRSCVALPMPCLPWPLPLSAWHFKQIAILCYSPSGEVESVCGDNRSFLSISPDWSWELSNPHSHSPFMLPELSWRGSWQPAGMRVWVWLKSKSNFVSFCDSKASITNLYHPDSRRRVLWQFGCTFPGNQEVWIVNRQKMILLKSTDHAHKKTSPGSRRSEMITKYLRLLTFRQSRKMERADLLKKSLCISH